MLFGVLQFACKTTHLWSMRTFRKICSTADVPKIVQKVCTTYGQNRKIRCTRVVHVRMWYHIMSCSKPYANHRGLQTTLVYILCSRQPGDDRFTLIKEPFKRQSNYSVDRANAHASAFLQAWSLPACLGLSVLPTTLQPAEIYRPRRKNGVHN